MKRALAGLLFLALVLLSPLVAASSELANHHTVKWTGPKSGHALYYTDSSYRRIGRIRVKQGYIKHVLPRGQVAGYTAVTDCSKVGHIAYISLNGGPVERYQILDCSQPYHAAGHVRARRVAEVDASSFIRNGCKLSRGRCPAVLIDIRRK